MYKSCACEVKCNKLHWKAIYSLQKVYCNILCIYLYVYLCICIVLKSSEIGQEKLKKKKNLVVEPMVKSPEPELRWKERGKV